MPITVDELVPWDNLLLRVRLATELVGRDALPLSAKWIAENMPHLFTPDIAEGQKPSIRAVEMALAKARLTLKANRSTSIYYLIEPLRFAFVLFRTRKGGRERLALVRRDCDDPQAALTQALGEVVQEFRFEPEAAQPEPEAGGQLVRVEVSLGWGCHTLGQLPLRADIQIDLPKLRASLPAGEVAPFHRVALPVKSEIIVAPPISFPELATWDEGGRRTGWNFGLSVPAEFYAAV